MSKIVTKPWGNELWISDGTETPFALKKIFFKAGNQTSIQVHKFKVETNFVLEGTGIFLLSDEKFDIDTYLGGGMSDREVEDFISTMQSLSLEPGMSYVVQPGQVHRVIALTDLTFIEASSTELDDVIRLKDDTNRTHGKINSEHS